MLLARGTLEAHTDLTEPETAFLAEVMLFRVQTALPHVLLARPDVAELAAVVLHRFRLAQHAIPSAAARGL
jgi:hypothetical protein